MNHPAESDRIALAQFEEAMRALRAAIDSAQAARQHLNDSLDPQCRAKIDEGAHTLGALASTLHLAVAAHDHCPPPADPDYRRGLLCVAGGVSYWHTGYSYILARGDADGHQIDLRELPRFKEEVDNRFHHATGFRFDEKWLAMAAADPAIARAHALLNQRSEILWWKLVTDFLYEHHDLQANRQTAIALLRAAGMPAKTIHEVIPIA